VSGDDLATQVMQFVACLCRPERPPDIRGGHRPPT